MIALQSLEERMNLDHSQQDFEATVREEVNGLLAVGFMDPVAVWQLTTPGVGRVAHEVRQRLERVRSALGGSAC